uniref:Ovule protein n=1 Tax=Anisakis simplex TaxID=6269 RepID=A0A0M3JMG6_ANISI
LHTRNLVLRMINRKKMMLLDLRCQKVCFLGLRNRGGLTGYRLFQCQMKRSTLKRAMSTNVICPFALCVAYVITSRKKRVSN